MLDYVLMDTSHMAQQEYKKITARTIAMRNSNGRDMHHTSTDMLPCDCRIFARMNARVHAMLRSPMTDRFDCLTEASHILIVDVQTDQRSRQLGHDG